VIDWIGTILILGGFALNIRKNWWCWPVWVVGTGLWLCVYWRDAQWAGFAQSSVFQVMNLWGWYVWGKK
jgi:hypothetical protein